jgi:hypothetical protein
MPHTRVISILGLGNRRLPPADGPYDQTTYTDGHLEVQSQLCAVHHLAAARAAGQEVAFVAAGTHTALGIWRDQGALADVLTAAHLDGVPVHFLELPEGSAEGDAARFVATLLPYLSTGPVNGIPAADDIVFDVTHGFRAQSVLATAAVEAAIDERLREPGNGDSGSLNIRLLYGAYAPGGPALTPVWDLTGLVLQHQWSSAIHAFARYCRADAFARLCKALAARIIRVNPQDRERQQKRSALDAAAAAARDFADSVATARIFGAVTRCPKALAAAIDAALPLLASEAPSCRSALEALRARLATFHADRLLSRDGVRAATAVARFAYDTDRISECIALMREIAVVTIALGREGEGRFGAAGPAREERLIAELDFERTYGGALRALGSARQGGTPWHAFASAILDLRNDVQHAGLRADPRSEAAVRQQCGRLLDTLPGLLETPIPEVAPVPPPGPPAR